VSALIEVENVSKRFEPRLTLGERIAAALGSAIETRTVHALDRVSLTINAGEVVGLVGESGCGKSTLGRVIAGILPPSSGAARIGGEPVMAGGRRPVKRTTRVQMVFQDPFGSLDPRMRVGEAIAEGPVAHGLVTRSDAARYVAKWLEAVGLDGDFVSRFPHQFSGGQRQRIAIARALAMQPDVLVCDEPVASLDVSIQAQIINLFLKLRRELGLTMLFISHDLGVVRHISDRIAIMYLGRIVELGDARATYAKPLHPYTARCSTACRSWSSPTARSSASRRSAANSRRRSRRRAGVISTCAAHTWSSAAALRFRRCAQSRPGRRRRVTLRRSGEVGRGTSSD
jgi:peptide/nickel transport system ATP-binding protein